MPPGAELSKRDIQLFIKRLRKRNSGIRYFVVGEYGTQKGRPHYHAVIFNLLDLDLITYSWTDNHGNAIGHVVGARATMGRIRYMVEYMALPQIDDGRQKAFRLMSRNPGIGANYIQKWKGFHKARSDSVIYDFDTPCAMPRYYRDKIFNIHQRQLVILKARLHSENFPKPICYVEHDKLLNRLKRKQR